MRVPELKPGDIVDANEHQSWQSKRPTRDCFCPTDDFNPIANAFAKLKALLRKAGEGSIEGI